MDRASPSLASDPLQSPDCEFDDIIRHALKTPPISNEEIERRSKEARKRG
jgi:hypothetical protein